MKDTAKSRIFDPLSKSCIVYLEGWNISSKRNPSRLRESRECGRVLGTLPDFGHLISALLTPHQIFAWGFLPVTHGKLLLLIYQVYTTYKSGLSTNERLLLSSIIAPRHWKHAESSKSVNCGARFVIQWNNCRANVFMLGGKYSINKFG